MNQSMDSHNLNLNAFKTDAMQKDFLVSPSQNSNRINMVHMNQSELKAVNNIPSGSQTISDKNNYTNLETIKKRVAYGVSTTQSTQM